MVKEGDPHIKINSLPLLKIIYAIFGNSLFFDTPRTNTDKTDVKKPLFMYSIREKWPIYTLTAECV